MLSAIVLAAGIGRRIESKISKPLIKINQKPLAAYSLKVLSKNKEIDEIIVVCNSQNKKQIIEIIKKGSFKKIKAIVIGGARRQDSVYNGLKNINPKSRLVLIHDSARPFVGNDSIKRVIKAAEKNSAAILAVPVKATIKSVKGCFVDKTLDRNKLWEIQTPQVFDKDLIIKAYKKYNRLDVTDDSSLVEKLGKPVSVVMGSYQNIKITTKVDLLAAELIAKEGKYEK